MESNENNICFIHRAYTINELKTLCNGNSSKVISIIQTFLEQKQLPKFFISFQQAQNYNMKISIKVLACLLQLTLEYIRYGIDFESTNANEFNSKYEATFEHINLSICYDKYIVPKLVSIISIMCSCKTMEVSCLKYDNVCSIHQEYTNIDLKKICKTQPLKLIGIIKNYLEQKKLPNYFISFSTQIENMEITNKIMACFLQLTLEYVKYGLDFDSTQPHVFISKYNFTFNNIDESTCYEIYTEPKLTALINYICSCNFDINVNTDSTIYNYLKLQNIKPHRIEIIMNNLLNINDKTIDCVTLDKLIEGDNAISRLIHPYIIETFPIKTDYIKFDEKNNKFMSDAPYLLHPNMIEYLSWHLSNKNFSYCNDVHHAIHGEILYIKSIKLYNQCISHFPWKAEKIIINNDTIGFVTKSPYNVHPNRLPYVIKQLSLLDVSICDDIPTLIHDKLISMTEITKKIDKYIIGNFPSNNSNVLITNDSIEFTTSFPYNFPKSRLTLLNTLLSKIDYVNCDDIHLAIHTTIINTLNKLSSPRPKLETYTIDSTSKLPENIWIEIFKAHFAQKPMYFNDENSIEYDTKVWIYLDEDIPTLRKIEFGDPICIMCNKIKKTSQNYDISMGNTIIQFIPIKKCPYVCKKLCSMSIKNSKHITSRRSQQYYNDSIWKLRHLKTKLILIKYSHLELNSIFNILPYDIINVLMNMYVDVVI